MESPDLNTRLRKSLLCSYDPSVSPSKPNQPVMVSFDYILKGFEFVIKKI